jgi:hypothetical protein
MVEKAYAIANMDTIYRNADVFTILLENCDISAEEGFEVSLLATDSSL